MIYLLPPHDFSSSRIMSAVSRVLPLLATRYHYRSCSLHCMGARLRLFGMEVRCLTVNLLCRYSSLVRCCTLIPSHSSSYSVKMTAGDRSKKSRPDTATRAVSIPLTETKVNICLGYIKGLGAYLAPSGRGKHKRHMHPPQFEHVHSVP